MLNKPNDELKDTSIEENISSETSYKDLLKPGTYKIDYQDQTTAQIPEDEKEARGKSDVKTTTGSTAWDVFLLLGDKKIDISKIFTYWPFLWLLFAGIILAQDNQNEALNSWVGWGWLVLKLLFSGLFIFIFVRINKEINKKINSQKK